MRLLVPRFSQVTVSQSRIPTKGPVKFTRTMATARQQPPWRPPPGPTSDVDLPRLKIYNSLTRSLEPFVPIDAKGEEVTWYACGPTVYDDAHLGHARNYVSTDIIRRIMRDFFNYNVRFVMNITDVDDKVRPYFLLYLMTA